EISAKYGISKDQAKLRIKTILEELKNNNEVGRVKYLEGRKANRDVLFKKSQPNESSHRNAEPGS
ncbi:MAG: ATPase, partial [Thermoplasmatales archaeon E-plasma]